MDSMVEITTEKNSSDQKNMENLTVQIFLSKEINTFIKDAINGSKVTNLQCNVFFLFVFFGSKNPEKH